MKVLLIIFLLPTATCLAQNTPVLFPFVENERWGFLDSLGQVVISPIYRAAGDFSEGLAPVRVNGRYGYVDSKGELVISDRFDYAEAFKDGLGKVWLHGKPFFIDKTGTLTYPDYYPKLEGFKNGSRCAVVQTTSDKMGVIDRGGKLVLDTIFMGVQVWGENRFIATYLDSFVRRPVSIGHSIYFRQFHAAAVFDTDGQVIIPAGQYEDMRPEGPEIAEVKIWGDTTAYIYSNINFINRDGRFFHLHPDRHFDYDCTHRWSGGMKAITILEKPYNEWKATKTGSKKKGWLLSDGQMIEPDTILEGVTDFQDGRTFGFWRRDKAYLYGADGKRVCERIFERSFPIEPGETSYMGGFWQGVAVVMTDSGWIDVIDTMGRTLHRLQRGHGFQQIYPAGELWLLSDWNHWAIWDPAANVLSTDSFLVIDTGFGFRHGLLRALAQDGRLLYVDRKGKTVWRQQSPPKAHSRIKLSTDEQLYGHFFAASPTRKEFAGAGGWATSGNFSQKIKKRNSFPRDSLSLIIRPQDTTTFAQRYEAFKVYLVNTTGDNIIFEASDSRLYMTIEVQDEEGQWKSIQYLPSSWCGNSHHQVYLAPGEYWQFAIPVFEGEIKTQLRVSLDRVRDPKNGFRPVLISNAIPISINPGQIWRKPSQRYGSAGIMSPYFNE